MTIEKLLIANRGEVAVRIARAAAALDIATVAVYAPDDAAGLHTRLADDARMLSGQGVAAYLDSTQLLEIASETGCDAVHPGYGFLSENDVFARACEAAGLTFIGPSADTLATLGDKARARELAEQHAIPVTDGTQVAVTLDQARAFMNGLGAGAPVMLKAVAGGGGRGMQAVRDVDELDAAFERCATEAQAAFGNDALYLERLIEHARHIEVQVVGDGRGDVSHLGERECSLQRRHQKLVEIAPCPDLSADLRERITAAAITLASASDYRSLGTFEFLVDDSGRFAFIEANPRLQVEHTVTEQVTGIDLVQAQIRLAGGATLASLGLRQRDIPPPAGHALQLRVNMETMDEYGNAHPAAGTLTAFEPPTGPGVRVDTFGYSGYQVSPHYDSLLAKLVVHCRSRVYASAVHQAYRALCQFRIDGVATNIGFLQNLLSRPEVQRNQVYTRFVDVYIAELATPSDAHPRLYFEALADAAAKKPAATAIEGPAGSTPATTPTTGVVVAVQVAEGEAVRAGQTLAIIEAMKMQHEIAAPVSGIVRAICASAQDSVLEAQPLAFIEPADVEDAGGHAEQDIDLDAIRADLADVRDRHALGLDDARPEAVARRRRRGHRTARENIARLCDPDSFIEYGALTHAAQRQRRSLDDLIRATPADGLVGGIGAVNGDWFDDARARCMVLAYDYMVLAGTQGTMNHKKTDRLLGVAEELALPIVFFAEGGGGRPGDTDNATLVAGLDGPSFLQYARLSGLAPRIAVVSGRCFAGNAVIAGCSDLLIATEESNLGMAGPAMIEGGGLGSFAPEEVGPVSVQRPNGVIDFVAADENEAVDVAKQLMAYFQGAIDRWQAADQRWLRRSVPQNRVRSYDVRALIDTLADTESVLELRAGFAPGLITAFARIEGRAIGLIANDPRHNGGAIDADGADKAARFMQLCDAFDLPMVSLCDTPGFMVGPDAEHSALVRHTSRLFVVAANIQVPLFTIVLRKGYGLGAQGMAGGSFHAPLFNAAWPTGEFGGMGLEGAVQLAYRKELDAVADADERKALYDRLVGEYYERGKATSMAAALEIDAVIDPADTRAWITRGLRSLPAPLPRHGKKRAMIDTW